VTFTVLTHLLLALRVTQTDWKRSESQQLKGWPTTPAILRHVESNPNGLKNQVAGWQPDFSVISETVHLRMD